MIAFFRNRGRAICRGVGFGGGVIGPRSVREKPGFYQNYSWCPRSGKETGFLVTGAIGPLEQERETGFLPELFMVPEITEKKPGFWSRSDRPTVSEGECMDCGPGLRR